MNAPRMQVPPNSDLTLGMTCVDKATPGRSIWTMLADERFGLVEKLADRVARVVIDEFGAPRVTISVTKLGVLREAKRVGVRLERSKS